MHPLDTTANAAPSNPEQNNPDHVEESQQIRDILKPVYDEIARRIPENSPYKQPALLGLEAASMWAIKAIFHRRR